MRCVGLACLAATSTSMIPSTFSLRTPTGHDRRKLVFAQHEQQPQQPDQYHEQQPHQQPQLDQYYEQQAQQQDEYYIAAENGYVQQAQNYAQQDVYEYADALEDVALAEDRLKQSAEYSPCCGPSMDALEALEAADERLAGKGPNQAF